MKALQRVQWNWLESNCHDVNEQLHWSHFFFFQQNKLLSTCNLLKFVFVLYLTHSSPNIPFPYPLKTSENLTVEKGSIGNKWVKQSFISNSLIHTTNGTSVLRSTKWSTTLRALIFHYRDFSFVSFCHLNT